MNIKRRLPLILGAALPGVAMLSLSGEAVAQQQSASAAAMLEEVIVTARRREESLQDLPLSVQALTADAMQAQGIYTMDQLTDFVPNLAMQEDIRANDTRMFIRGIGGGFSNPAQVFGVGMYVDGHYLSGSLGAFMSTLDVERVEVLRGPQGTLFGKNTTGGAVSIVSAKPGPDFDSYVTLRAGDYGQADVRGMLNFPITDSLFMRLNAASETTDGYYYNDFLNKDTGGTDQQTIGVALRWLPTDSWTIDARIGSARDRDDNRGGQCFPYPDADLLDALVADGQDISGIPGPYPDGNGSWGGSFGGIGRVDLLYRGATVDMLRACGDDAAQGPFVTSQDYNTRSYVDNDMFTLNSTWAPDGPIGAFENASLQIQGAWRYTSYRYQQDRDFAPLPIDHVGNYPNLSGRGVNRYTDEFEIIFNGDINDRLNFTAGLYWFDDDARTGNRTCIGLWQAAYDPNGVSGNPGPDGIPGTADDIGTINGQFDDDVYCPPEGGTLFERLPDTTYTGLGNGYGNTRGESQALYAHLDWSITDAWDMAIGARAMQDTRWQTNAEVDIQPGSCTHKGIGNWSTQDTIEVGDPGRLEQCQAVTIFNRDTLLNNGVYTDTKADYSEVVPTFSITRNLTPGERLDSGMMYFTYSQGWLTGAFNDELNSNLPEPYGSAVLDLIAYGPETVTNYEFGFKGTMYDGRLRLNADVFYMDYADKQEVINIDNSDGRFGSPLALEYTDNASNVDITGIELELRASPWDGGFFSLDLGMLDSKYRDFQLLDLDTLQYRDATDTDIKNRIPDWTLTASVEHAFQLSNGGTFTPQLGLYMQDDYEWQANLVGERSTNCHQDSYQKWRLRATYEPADANWQASVFGYNITDELILAGCGNTRSGAMRWYHERPAWWGAEFTMRFGGGN